MKILVYIVKLFSRLPLGILYVVSDVFFVLNYYLVGYRRNVIFTNIRNSFPEKSENEIKKIQKQFFRNFADYIVETLKALTISENELKVRVQHINRKVFDEAKAEQKNVILLTGHVFNWEWFTGLANMVPQQHSHPVYKKVKNEFWGQEIVSIRNRFGNESVESREVMRHMLKTPNDGNSIYMFVADQSPKADAVYVGTEFLHQKTPVFIGYDKISTRMNLAFVYCEMKKVKRGFYQVNYYRIYPENERFQELEVVKKFHILLENTIRKHPDNYLWSHKRWKYTNLIKKMI